MIPHATQVNPEEYADSDTIAAPGAAVGQPEIPNNSDLQAVIERWSDPPEPVRAGILAMVRSSSSS
jgi:hypothetical protein